MHATTVGVILLVSGFVVGCGYQSMQVQDNTFSGYHCVQKAAK